MTRRLTMVLLLAACPAIYAADALPTPEAIFDKYIQVTGGKQAYANRKSEIVTGRLDFAAQGIKGNIKRWSAAPDKYYSTLEIAGIGNIEMGVTDGVAWEKSAIMGARIKTGVERSEAIREATINSTVRWKELFTKVTVEGVETIDGEECYKVVMQPSEGKPMTQYFQKKSGLAVKVTTVATSQMGEVPVEITVSDYKNFGGIWVAAKTAQKAAGQEFTMTIESVEPNPDIPAERFEMPAEIKALAAKAAGAK